MKIGQLYDLDKFKAFTDSGGALGFQDSSSGILLARNLTAINPKIFEKKYPELSFVNSGITVDNTGGYARRIQSLRIIEQGDFTDSSDLNAGKGRISLEAEDSFLKVFPKEAHSIWTDDDIEEAKLGNFNLVQKYLATHNKTYTQKIDEIGYLGHNGQEGLLNYSGWTTDSATGAIGTLTAQQMYNDISGLITTQRNAVNNTPEYSCNRVVMPVYVLNTLNVTMLNTASGNTTVLKALRDNFTDINFVVSFRANSVGGTSKVVAYSTNEDAMVMRIPIKLTIGEIIKNTSFNFRVDSKFRIAGLDVLEDTSGRVLSGL